MCKFLLLWCSTYSSLRPLVYLPINSSPLMVLSLTSLSSYEKQYQYYWHGKQLAGRIVSMPGRIRTSILFVFTFWVPRLLNSSLSKGRLLRGIVPVPDKMLTISFDVTLWIKILFWLCHSTFRVDKISSSWA